MGVLRLDEAQNVSALGLYLVHFFPEEVAVFDGSVGDGVEKVVNALVCLRAGGAAELGF